MKTVCEVNQCTGCMACVDICPKKAIHIEDSLSAYNAIIDSQLCVDCNLCHRVCQNNTELEFRKPTAWYQGWASDTNIRKKSSSGGVASAFIQGFIDKGGIVCSCVFSDGKFGFEFAESLEETHKFSGSKYVKSNPVGIYKRIKQKLNDGIKVLFIGLPCQVAAVKLFVGENLSENLYTVDLICHGSPSPKFFEKFTEEYGYSVTSLENVSFRKKDYYHVFRGTVGFEPDKVQDAYTFAFLNCLDHTENCYSCKYARQERIGDLTIGDSWGSALPESEQKQGISLMLCQSEKGKYLLENSPIQLLDVDLETAIENNKQLMHPSNQPTEREKFFRAFSKCQNFHKAVQMCYPMFFLKQRVKKILIKCHLIT